MSYDLYAFPVDRDMSLEEAVNEIGSRSSRWRLGVRRDKRIDAFEKAMAARFPGIGTVRSEYPMEFDVSADYVHMALPWPMVAELLGAIAPLAFEAGLAVFDPQRTAIAMPAPFGSAPLDAQGVEEHEAWAARALGTIASGATLDADGSFSAEAIRESGARLYSPLGFEITPDIEAEVLADPLRVPTSLQTPERKANLLRQLEDPVAATRHDALRALGGFDPDPEVHAALLPSLDSDDAFTVGFAAAALARQGDAVDLPLLLAAVHRMSPADGGTIEAMSMPLMAAFGLAQKAGPSAVADVRSKAWLWREAPDGSRRRGSMTDQAFGQMLDVFAAGPQSLDGNSLN
jgi:hypothetical protein